ncbi:MAG: PAS domain S-box protein [Magnetococcales bacterium]|nr:PAS domain S-box protein [Magnetococcales bacterium]
MTLQSKFLLAIATAMIAVLSLGVWLLERDGQKQRDGLLERETQVVLGFARSSLHSIHNSLQPTEEGVKIDLISRDELKKFAQSNRDTSLRQPTPSPLNASQTPTLFEAGLIQTFQDDPSLTELKGFFRDGKEEVYYFALPNYAQGRCLSCHGTPQQLSLEAVSRLDLQKGQGWQAGQLIGATVITIPIQGALKTTADGQRFILLTFAAIFLSLAVLAQFFFQSIIGQRLKRSGQLMLEIAQRPDTNKRFTQSGPDEVGQMEKAFNQVVDAFQETQRALHSRLQQLVEEEDRFRSLANSASDGFISADEDQTILSWNQGASDIFGYKEQEVLGQSIRCLIPERYLSAHQQGFVRILSEGRNSMDRKPKEAMAIHKLGHEIPIEVSLSSWTTGGRRHFSAIVRDTTERERAKEKSQRELLSRIALNTMLEVGLKSISLKGKLERILQVTLAVHWLSIQFKGCIFLMNEKSGQLVMAAQHGLDEATQNLCQTVPVGRCICGHVAASRQTVFAKAMDSRHDITFEGQEPHGHYCVPIMHEARLLGVLNFYLQPGHDSNPEEERFIKTVAHTLAGVIDREYAARRLRQLSQATEESPASLVITSPQGVIEYVNKKCCTVTGYSKEELVGKTPGILKSGELPDGVYRDLWTTILAGKEWRGELHNRKKNGELYWEDVAISAVRNRGGEITHFLAVKEDITQRKELEDALGNLLSTLDHRVAERTEELNAKIEELGQTRNELIESEKMASLGRLVAGFAHEINTPIGVAVAGSSQIEEAINCLERLVAQDEVEEEKILHIMDIIREASVLTLNNLRRAGSLVASFKRTSVNQSTDEARLFDMLETSQDVIRSLHNALKKTRIKVRLICSEPIKIFGNPGILDQLLTNLIMNSIIHGFKDGSLEGEIIITINKVGSRLDLNFRDTGVGMEESVRRQIFEPFYTTHRSHGGSGLGLYLCYNLVTSKLNGTITCGSSKAGGVEFHISFPIGDKIV